MTSCFVSFLESCHFFYCHYSLFSFSLLVNFFSTFGPVTTKDDMQNPLPPLRSGHLNIKDAECAESIKKSCFRFLIFELLVVKELPIWLQKNNFFQKWPNLQGQLGLNWQWFFSLIIFYVQFLVFEMWSILYIHLCNAWLL